MNGVAFAARKHETLATARANETLHRSDGIRRVVVEALHTKTGGFGANPPLDASVDEKLQNDRFARLMGHDSDVDFPFGMPENRRVNRAVTVEIRVLHSPVPSHVWSRSPNDAKRILCRRRAQ